MKTEVHKPGGPLDLPSVRFLILVGAVEAGPTVKSPSFQRAATLNGYKPENGANIPVIFTHIATKLRKLDVNVIFFPQRFHLFARGSE